MSHYPPNHKSSHIEINFLDYATIFNPNKKCITNDDHCSVSTALFDVAYAVATARALDGARGFHNLGQRTQKFLSSENFNLISLHS